MCTLCLSDMGELRDDWLREPKAKLAVLGVDAKAPPPIVTAKPRHASKPRAHSLLEAAAGVAALP